LKHPRFTPPRPDPLQWGRAIRAVNAKTLSATAWEEIADGALIQ
jgi:hypothetical protein